MKEEIYNKRQSFQEHIRRNQKERLFKKIRKENNEYNLFLETDFENINSILHKLAPIINSLEDVYQHENEILDFIAYARRLSNVPRGNVLNQVFVFLARVSNLIHYKSRMDIESVEGLDAQEIDCQSSFLPFPAIINKIGYFLINFMAEDDDLVAEYIDFYRPLLKERSYIDAYHNLFLNQKIGRTFKIQFLQNFLHILQSNPSMYLNSLHKYTPILYYAVFQPPSLIPEQALHPSIIRLLVKQFSILEFNQRLNDSDKNDFRGYACAILEKICHRNHQNCFYLVVELSDSAYLFRDLELVLKGLRRQLLGERDCGNSKVTQTKKRKQTEQLDGQAHHSVLSCLNLLINLTFYEDIGAQILRNRHPQIWIYVMEIYSHLEFAPPTMNLTVEKTLRIVSNILADCSSCHSFITYSSSPELQSKNLAEEQICAGYSTIRVLNKVFEHFYKSPSIRAECIYVISNIISVLCKEVNSCTKMGETGELEVVLKVIESCKDLLYEILKAGSQYEDLTNSLLRNLRFLLQECGAQFYKDCHLVRDLIFTAKVRQIAESDEQADYGYTQYGNRYSQQTRLEAQLFCEAIAIFQEN